MSTLNPYQVAEKRLAELLGYKEIFRLRVGGEECGSLQYNKGKYTGAEQVPRWCRDWTSCGPLMVEHNVGWTISKAYEGAWRDTIEAKCQYVGMGTTEETGVSDHPDKETAIRYAIVLAVIAKLESRINGTTS